MVEICEVDVPRQKFLECPNCVDIFFKRIGRVSFGAIAPGPAPGPIFQIIVIRRYVLRKCFLGLAIGQHVHSLTMLPGEQLEIEVVRRSKFSRALHEQRSVESEFRFELQSTARDEWSSEEESNFKVTAEEDFSIFCVGVESTQEYSTREKTAEEHFREIISKTSSRVSRKFEVAIDTKTEVENEYRSVRKITNPNPCQPVMYSYFQLAKKYKTELILTDIRFDFQPRVPPILTTLQAILTIAPESPYRENVNLNVVAPPPPWTLSAGSTPATPAGIGTAVFSLVTAPVLGTVAQPTIAGLPTVRPTIETPEFLELTKDELLAKVGTTTDPQAVAILRQQLDAFLNDPANKTGAKDTYEYCVNTDGLYVEANTSKCSACEETAVKLKQLEVEKAQLEVELKKREL